MGGGRRRYGSVHHPTCHEVSMRPTADEELLAFRPMARAAADGRGSLRVYRPRRLLS